MPGITSSAIIMAVFAFLLGGVAGAVIVYFRPKPKEDNQLTSPSPSDDTPTNAAKEEFNGSSGDAPPIPTQKDATPSADPKQSSDKQKLRGGPKNQPQGSIPSPQPSAIPKGLAQVREALNRAEKGLNLPTERDELLKWLDDWIQQLEKAQIQIKNATPDLLAKDQTSTLDGLLRTLYQPQLPSTLPPQGDKTYEALLPILHGALRCCVTLADDLKNKLGVEPILPHPGDTFDPAHHDGLAAHRRKAVDGQTVGTIYRLISPGLQKSAVQGGEVLLKAEVGVYESRS